MKPVGHSVRRVHPDEADILAELRLSALLDAPSAFASTHASEALRTPNDWAHLAIRRSSGDEEATFIAWDGDSPAGLIGAYRSHDDDRVELVSMWTAPASRERGVRVARTSARKGRAQALNQMRGLISTAPEPIWAELRGLNVFHLLERAATYRPGAKRDVVSLTKFTLRMLARRAIILGEEISEIDAILKPLVIETRTPTRRHSGRGHRRCLGICWSLLATIPSASTTRPPLHISAVPHRSKPAAASRSATGSIEAVIARPTPLCGTS